MSDVALSLLVVAAAVALMWVLSSQLAKHAPSSKRRPRKPSLQVRPRANPRRRRRG